MKLVGRLLRTYVKPHAKAMVVRFLIAAAVAATPYAFSFLGKWLVDEAIQVTGPSAAQGAKVAAGGEDPSGGIEWRAKTTEEKLRLLGIFLAASLGIHVVVTGLSAASEYLNSKTVQDMTYRMRSEVHEKLAGLEMGVFSREQVGQLMTRTLDDTGGIPGNLCNLVINSATQVAMLVLGLVLLVRLNPGMTLVPLAALPFYAVVCIIFLPRLRRVAEEARERGTRLNGRIIERLSSILTIKNYAQEERERDEFMDMFEGNLKVGRRQHRLGLYFDVLSTLITGSSTLAVLAFGFLSIQSGRMQLGEVLAFHQVTAQLFVPISALVGMTTVAQTIELLGERVFGLLDLPETIQDAPDAVEPADVRGDVTFEGVSLRYSEGGPFAVRNVSLSIEAGQTVCVVGPTGCGKSTLIALLTRLYDPTGGRVLLDGMPLQQFKLRGLRRSIGNILYDCQVFAGTFQENIRFGTPNVTADEIADAATCVGLDGFICAQPGQYAARIGRGGLTLSRQQLVQLAVARALVTKPAVLTIDDTFATIEEDVEAQLRRALNEVLANRTVLMATSRLAICHDADLVVVMQRGRILQTGTHEALLAVPGVYRRMYMRQMGMAEAEPEPDEGRTESD